MASLDTSGCNILAVTASTGAFTNKKAGLVVTCNDQDITLDGTGVAATGALFREICQ